MRPLEESLKIVFVDTDSGKIILTENNWQGEHPVVGEVIELHSGPTSKWTILEVDWVFEEAQPDTEDVPMKLLKVLVKDYDRARSMGNKPHDPICTCGHKRSMHAPGRCLGDASTCACRGFTDPLGLDVI